MPFLGRRLDELVAFAQSIRQPELKLRQGVVQVGGGPSIERRRAAVEVKFSARTGSKLWLPVIQVMVHDVGTRADLVLSMGPSDVVGAREAPVVAISGIPSLGVAYIGEPRNSEKWESAASQVRSIVGAGEPQHIRPNVLANVGRLAILAHARKTHVAVDDKIGREG